MSFTLLCRVPGHGLALSVQSVGRTFLTRLPVAEEGRALPDVPPSPRPLVSPHDNVIGRAVGWESGPG